MAKRSTRNRLRGQAKAVINDLDRAMEHLQNVDLYADGRSEEITETLPKLVVMLDEVTKVFVAWRERL